MIPTNPELSKQQSIATFMRLLQRAEVYLDPELMIFRYAHHLGELLLKYSQGGSKVDQALEAHPTLLVEIGKFKADLEIELSILNRRFSEKSAILGQQFKKRGGKADELGIKPTNDATEDYKSTDQTWLEFQQSLTVAKALDDYLGSIIEGLQQRKDTLVQRSINRRNRSEG